MWMKKIVICVIILFAGSFGEVQGQGYHTGNLVKNLLKIRYPLNKEDAIALNKIGMRFDAKNRINVLEKILRDRDFIHSRKNVDYFIRTDIICDALRLLNEHDLPYVDTLIDTFNNKQGWEKREKVLLAYMAARRNIRYPSNAAYLRRVLLQYDRDLEKIYSGETSQAIIDVINFLSYLSDLYVYKGDKDVLISLIKYSSTAYGYPAEHLSHLFVEMFLRRPKIFLSTLGSLSNLSSRDYQNVNTVINSLVFGIRNNEVRVKVKGVLQKDLFIKDEPNQRSIDLIIEKLNKQIDLTFDSMLPSVPDPHKNSIK